MTLSKRSKSRLTKQGIIYERRIIALRRIQAQLPTPPGPNPTEDEVERSRTRWAMLRRLI